MPMDCHDFWDDLKGSAFSDKTRSIPSANDRLSHIDKPAQN